MEFLPQLHDFSSDLWVRAMLDDRKLSARALFDDSSHRQTQLAVRAQTGKTLCYRLPFHVYVSVGTHLPSFIHTQQDGKVTFLCFFFLHVFCLQCRTQQITFVLSASHCGLRSTTQKVVPCWMKGGRLLSTNL